MADGGSGEGAADSLLSAVDGLVVVVVLVVARGGQCGEWAAAENHGGRPVGAAVPDLWDFFSFFLFFCQKFADSPGALTSHDRRLP